MLLTQTSPPLEKTHTSNPLSRYGSVCMFDVANTNYSPLSENPHLEPRFPDARRSARESPPLIGSPRKLPRMMLRTKSTLCSVTCRVSATTTHPATLRKGLDEDAIRQQNRAPPFGDELGDHCLDLPRPHELLDIVRRPEAVKRRRPDVFTLQHQVAVKGAHALIDRALRTRRVRPDFDRRH